MFSDSNALITTVAVARVVLKSQHARATNQVGFTLTALFATAHQPTAISQMVVAEAAPLKATSPENPDRLEVEVPQGAQASTLLAPRPTEVREKHAADLSQGSHRGKVVLTADDDVTTNSVCVLRFESFMCIEKVVVCELLR
jgi:hypothetical protein